MTSIYRLRVPLISYGQSYSYALGQIPPTQTVTIPKVESPVAFVTAMVAVSSCTINLCSKVHNGLSGVN